MVHPEVQQVEIPHTILMRASETSAKYIIMKKLLTDFSEEKGLEPPEFELISGDADYVTKLHLIP